MSKMHPKEHLQPFRVKSEIMGTQFTYQLNNYKEMSLIFLTLPFLSKGGLYEKIND